MRQTEKVRELLVGQPTVDTRDSLGTTPLMQCAEMGELQLMQWLIDHLADVNARDRFGQTPLMYAAGSNQLTAARLLLRYGANPALQDVAREADERLRRALAALEAAASK